MAKLCVSVEERFPKLQKLEKKPLKVDGIVNGAENLRILIAEDDVAMRFLLRAKLDYWGYEVVEARDGDEARGAFQDAVAPQLAILDWMMPGMDGIDLCRELRSIPDQKPLYIILLTAKGNKEDLIEGLKAGADDYMVKPFDPEELRARVLVGARVVQLQSDLARRVRELNEALSRLEERTQALQESETKHRLLLNSIPSSVLALTNDMTILYCNDAYARSVMKSTLALEGQKLLHLFPEQEGTWIHSQYLDAMRTGKTRLAEGVWDGVQMRARVCPTPWGVLSIAEDITEQKQAEKERAAMEVQLRQAQKLEAVGQLAAGIAHEINTPTQYVGDNLAFLRDAFSDLGKALKSYDRLLRSGMSDLAIPEVVAEADAIAEEADLEYLLEEIPRAMEQSQEGVDRVAKIVRAMKEFSHPGTGEKTATDIHKAINSTIMISRNEWKYVAEMVTDFDASLPPLPCFPGDFNQVILNLIINAAHAISDVVGGSSGEKGIITVRTRKDGDLAEIQISDTGSGIPEEVRAKIFDPFFTTKEVGRGTGQGLAIAHSVVVGKHGGTITFDSHTGEGTTFIIRLPIESNTAGNEVAPT